MPATDREVCSDLPRDAGSASGTAGAARPCTTLTPVEGGEAWPESEQALPRRGRLGAHLARGPADMEAGDMKATWRARRGRCPCAQCA